jgi:polyribonucleotide nucleotidyltransferase
MVEAGANEISEDQMISAIELAIPEIKKLALIQEDLREEAGKEKITVAEITVDESLKEAITPLFLSKIDTVLQSTEKLQRERALDDIKEETIKEALEKNPEKEADINYIFDDLLDKYLRKRTLEGIRVDGRKFSEIRDINVEVGLLKHTHGNGLFTRGQTQVLSIATLGAPEFKKRYMHYYNFPSFSVGEVRPMRGPSRREIGHGALAEKALLPVLPSEEEFPYTIRVISEVLESNGSSSMAATCGSTLALMDAGVPIKKAVAGIAMGLVSDGERYAILTDIQGAEDHFGDMDFKVTGTNDGITALQMDIKLKGIKLEILKEALNQAKDARLFILEKMLSVLPRPREEISPYAPRIFTMKISPDKIGLLIGPGGKTIKGIIGETEADINIEADGTVYVSAPDTEIGEQIKAQIIGLLEEPEANKIYTGKVVDIKDFGAFVQILPNSVGLLHVSQLSDKFVKDIKKEIKVGDEVKVRVMKVEPNGKIQLTRKGLEENSSQKRE